MYGTFVKINKNVELINNSSKERIQGEEKLLKEDFLLPFHERFRARILRNAKYKDRITLNEVCELLGRSLRETEYLIQRETEYLIQFPE